MIDLQITTDQPNMDEMRGKLGDYLAVLEAIRASVEASLRSATFSERKARGLGLREAPCR